MPETPPLHKLMFCLGSNLPDASSRVAEAVLWLRSVVSVTRATPPYQTLPEGSDISGHPYFNALVEAYSPLEPSALILMAKDYERSHGRLPGHKAQGMVVIDIDLVTFNSSVINRTNFSANYFRRGLPLLRPLR